MTHAGEARAARTAVAPVAAWLAQTEASDINSSDASIERRCVTSPKSLALGRTVDTCMWAMNQMDARGANFASMADFSAGLRTRQTFVSGYELAGRLGDNAVLDARIWRSDVDLSRDE